MKRSAYLAAAAVAVVVGGGGVATTASSAVPASTAGVTSIVLNGAVMGDVSYSIAAGVITGFTMHVQRKPLLTTATARFGSGATGACVVTTPLVSGDTTITCSGFAQQANASWRLTVSLT